MLISENGVDPGTLTTNQAVHKQFGEPSRIETVEGKSYESFVTRQMLRNHQEFDEISWGLGLTYGLYEFIAFPQQVYQLCHGTMFGRQVSFSYDERGKVTDIFLDGKKYRSSSQSTKVAE